MTQPTVYRCIRDAVIHSTGLRVFTAGKEYVADEAALAREMIIFIDDQDQPRMVAPGPDTGFLRRYFVLIDTGAGEMPAPPQL